MNCLKLLGNQLSILKNTNSLVCALAGRKQFSSLLGFPTVKMSPAVVADSKPLFKTNLNLTPSPVEIVPKCGIKVYGKPKLRCKHCYYAGIDGVLHVFCEKYPRHKSRAVIPNKKKFTWILSHACQSKYRAY